MQRRPLRGILSSVSSLRRMPTPAALPVPGTSAFDYRALGEAVEERRQELGLTESGLIRSVDWLSKGPLAKYRQGNPNPSCQFAIGLLRWLGRSPESFSPGMVDGPECRLPDFGPYALRWNMATLWRAADQRRLAQGLTWSDVREETFFADVEGISRQAYGIAMHDAMNVVRWLGQPAASFLYPSGLAPARPGSAAYGGPEKAAAESSAPNLGQIIYAGTVGKADEEIAEFALGRGGFANICYTIMSGLRSLPRSEDFEIGLDLGEGLNWTIRSSDGRTSFLHYVKKSASCVLEATPADFMRLVFEDLDLEAACQSGRIKLRGDLEYVVWTFPSFVSRQPATAST